MRACRRDALLALDLRDRRSGYPLEMVLAAAAAGWRVREVDVGVPAAHRPVQGHRHGRAGRVRAVRDMRRVLDEVDQARRRRSA